jgi:RNA polymerase sigma-70 factor (ECF subfamily)
LRNEDSVDEVIERYSASVYRLAMVYAKKAHDADDIFQDVFLRYISKPRTFESEEHRKAWLIRVTVNRGKTVSVRYKRTEPLTDDYVYEMPMFGDTNDIQAYLAKVPPRYRAAMYLFYAEGYTTREIAEILNKKESTVRSWLNRARAKLRNELKGEFNYG